MQYYLLSLHSCVLLYHLYLFLLVRVQFRHKLAKQLGVILSHMFRRLLISYIRIIILKIGLTSRMIIGRIFIWKILLIITDLRTSKFLFTPNESNGTVCTLIVYYSVVYSEWRYVSGWGSDSHWGQAWG